MPSRTEQILKNLRQSPVFCELIAQEAQMSWPLPLRVKNSDGDFDIYLQLFFFSSTPLKEQPGNGLTTPYAMITVSWKNQVVVEYQSLEYKPLLQVSNPNQIIGTFPHQSIAHLKRDEYLVLRNELLNLYDELFDTLLLAGELPPFWEKRFKELFSLLTEPPLQPYYRAIAPKFCNKFLIPS